MAGKIRIEVLGDPRPQPRQRHRAIQINGKLLTKNYTPKGDPVNTWKDLIALAAREKLPEHPLSGAVRVDSYYYFRRPKSHFRTGKNAHLLKDSAPLYHTKKPDRDNLDKSFMDIMTNLGFWKDDCQVYAGELVKRYAGPDNRPGATFVIEAMEE